jgi:hypothetical protein
MPKTATQRCDGTARSPAGRAFKAVVAPLANFSGRSIWSRAPDLPRRSAASSVPHL